MKKIAIPVNNGILSPHFGHCEVFEVYTIDNGEIIKKDSLSPPAHEPGAYPRLLAENGVQIIISSGMGHRAQSLFQQNNIEVYTGASYENPEELIKSFLDNELTTGQNPCDH